MELRCCARYCSMRLHSFISLISPMCTPQPLFTIVRGLTSRPPPHARGHCTSRKMKSTGKRAFQDESARHGTPASPQSSSPLSSTGSKSTHSGQLPSTPHQGLAPSLRITLLDEEVSQNRDPAQNKDRPFTARSRTISHPKSLYEGRTGWEGNGVGSSSFLQPMSAMRPRSGSSTKPRSVRSFSASSASVSAEDVLSLPLSVTCSRKRSSVGGKESESSEEQLDTQQPRYEIHSGTKYNVKRIVDSYLITLSVLVSLILETSTIQFETTRIAQTAPGQNLPMRPLDHPNTFALGRIHGQSSFCTVRAATTTAAVDLETIYWKLFKSSDQTTPQVHVWPFTCPLR